MHGPLGSTLRRDVEIAGGSDGSTHQESPPGRRHHGRTRARLRTLRMQLEPHFLLNALNSIAAVVEVDARAGQRMISRLGDFLRLTMEDADRLYVPLRKELELLDRYAEIERIRYGDRLAVTYATDLDASDCLIPPLLLQPLVENAIRHGIQPSIPGGTIRVSAGIEADRLVIAVIDDGVGAPPFDVDRHRGIGLANVMERLRRYFGDAHEFAICANSPRGTRVRIGLPILRAARPTRS